jgi:putative ABC transport system permease protein
VGVGDRLQLETPTGRLDRPILGLVENYSSEKGTVFMDRSLYKKFWGDSGVDSIDVNLLPGANRAAVKGAIEQLVAGEQQAFVYTNQEYEQWVMGLVNQFFTLHYMQMVIAICVAVLGIVNTLIISVAERRREIGAIRAIGGLRSQIRRMVVLEAVAIAVIGVVTGAVAGVLNTYFLVRTASTLLAGYTVPFTFPLTLIVTMLPIVIAIAAIAAWWPARRAVKLNVVEAIGYE